MNSTELLDRGGDGTADDQPATPAIQLSGVHRSFGQVRAVDGVDLDVSPGEVVAFLGPNGAGKTSTIDLLLGLSRPDTGRVTLFGMEPRQAVARGLVAAVMQTGGLLRDLTVAETVDLTASLFSSARPVQECLQRAGIDDIGSRLVGKCSGGQQQRLRFAMALVSDPALILLDEPTTGMDVTGRRDFWQAIHADARRGRTVLFATHYLEEADQYADRVVLMSHGRIVADGTAAEIRAMAGGRTLRCRLIGTDLATVQRLPGVTSAQLQGIDDGQQAILASSDSDATARALLELGARDLEITSRGLEDAFISLTSDSTSTQEVSA